MSFVEKELTGIQRIRLCPDDLIERDLGGASLKFEATRAVERIRQDRASTALGLAEDNRLLDERRFAVDGTEVFSDSSTGYGTDRHQSPIQAVRLIQRHRPTPCRVRCRQCPGSTDGRAMAVVAKHVAE